MHVHVFDSEENLGRFAALRILALIESRPQAVIGLATGSSPLSAYRSWAREARVRQVNQRGVRGFALDEYVGLPPGHPESYTSVIRATVTEPVGLRPELVRVPSGAGDLAAESAEFERAIRVAGGVDLQLLGIGRNGHLGFNEPGSGFDSRTREVQLTPETIADNARFFDGAHELVPTRSVTQGIGTILEARSILVLVLGEAKAEAVARAIEGPLDEELPASALQHHPRVTWLVDQAAASGLSSRTSLMRHDAGGAEQRR